MAMLMATGCASLGAGNVTMRNTRAEGTPPARVNSVDAVPVAQSTYHYKVDIYPGLDENFNPDPKLTLAEYNQISQLDWYCAKRVDELSGEFQEMMKQGITYGILEGVLGMFGMMIGFNPVAHPGAYLSYIGLTAAGGGLASGKVTFEETLNVAHGYCMTNMAYKADELEGKLRRVTFTPLYVGSAKLPTVSGASAPTYQNQKWSGGFIPPPAK